ncbi:MAG TPA: hypothetical protein VIJ09_10290 [Acidimicrobiales bacterium]
MPEEVASGPPLEEPAWWSVVSLSLSVAGSWLSSWCWCLSLSLVPWW